MLMEHTIPEGHRSTYLFSKPDYLRQKDGTALSVVNDKDYDRMIKSICDSNMFDYFVIAGYREKGAWMTAA